MYGAAGAPARSASAPVVRSARRPPLQATGSVEKGVPLAPTRSFPPEPQPVEALRGGEARAPGKEAAARAVAFCGRLRFCSLEKGAKLQAPLWSAGWCGRGRDGPQSSGYLRKKWAIRREVWERLSN